MAKLEDARMPSLRDKQIAQAKADAKKKAAKEKVEELKDKKHK